MPHRLLLRLALVLLAAPLARAADRPNVVFLLADDLGFSDPGFNGGRQIPTPHLDALAASGAILEQHYAQPLCSPTRASLLTGRYPFRYGFQVGVVRADARYGLPLDERLLPVALREVGYATALVGKWHLGLFDRAYWPGARGFDFSYGHLAGALDYFTHRRGGRLDWYRDGEPCEDEGYATDLIAREAVAFLERQDPDRPFFLYVPFTAVHAPFQAPESYLEPYAKLPEPRRRLAGTLAALDAAIGRIVGALEAKGLREHTLIVFCSDNGGVFPGRVTDNLPLRAGKASVYEGGVRVCACVSWPGVIEPGTRVAAMMHVVDWYPTILSLAGASLEQPLPLDGRDVWACVTKGAPSPHEELVLGVTPSGGAIRVGDWKLVVDELPGQEPTEELYHLSEDLGEKHDLAAEQVERRTALRARYDVHAKAAVKPLAASDDGD